MTDTSELREQREQSMLTLICLIGAGLFLALVAYNLFAAGSIISTHGLFFTVVPLVLGLSLLAVPAMDFLAKRKEAKLAAATSEGAAASPEAGDIIAHEETHEHFAGTNRLFLSVWGWLLLLTALEVFLGYIHLPVAYMLFFFKDAAITEIYTLSLHYALPIFERINLILTIVPALVICICLLLVFFPDSFRSKNLRYGPPPGAEGAK